MEVITIEKKTYEAMMERFRILTAKVDALCRECDKKKWASGRAWTRRTPICVYLFYVQPISKSDSRAVSCNRPFRSPPWVSSPS